MQNKAGEKNCSSVQQFFYCVSWFYVYVCEKKMFCLFQDLLKKDKKLAEFCANPSLKRVEKKGRYIAA